jgi:hypothetical protein
VTPGSPGSWDEPPSGPEIEITNAVLVDSRFTETNEATGEKEGLDLDGEDFLSRFGLEYDALDDEILEAAADAEQSAYDEACDRAYDAWKEDGKIGRPRAPRRSRRYSFRRF